MTPKPVVIGLLLCDRVIVDKDTNSPSAIGIFTGLAAEKVEQFDFSQPSPDALSGIYEEGNEHASPTSPKEQIAPAHLERLFGFTVTVEDESMAEMPASVKRYPKPAGA